jgi:hypothetical protein
MPSCASDGFQIARPELFKQSRGTRIDQHRFPFPICTPLRPRVLSMGLSLRLSPKRRIASRQFWFRETCRVFEGVGQKPVRPPAVHDEIFFSSTTAMSRVPVQQLPVFRHSCMPRIVISCRIPPCGPQTTDTKQQTMSRDKADKRTGQIDSWTASRTWPGQRNDHNPFR